MAGMGKSSLAGSCIRRLVGMPAEQAPSQSTAIEAICWITAEGGSVDLNGILNGIAEALEARAFKKRFDIEAKCQAILSLLRQHPLLIVLDNFETINDSRIVPFLARLLAQLGKLRLDREHLPFLVVG